MPPLNCGMWYELQKHSDGRSMVVIKNSCIPTFAAGFSVTMKNEDWAYAKTQLFADGDKFTPLEEDSCKDVGSGEMKCDIKLKTLKGIEQDRAGFLLPETHGDIGYAV